MHHRTIPKRNRTDKAATNNAIMEAALELFLQKGYTETTTDEIASLAGVSKQTLYRKFPDKQRLFDTLIRSSVERAKSFYQDILPTLDATDDLRALLRTIALRYIETIFQPRVLKLRRLVIAESHNFPELAVFYYEEVPKRTLTSLTKWFEKLMIQNHTQVKDPGTAARHFAALLIMLQLDKAMFGRPSSRREIEKEAFAGIEAFLAAYTTHTSRNQALKKQ